MGVFDLLQLNNGSPGELERRLAMDSSINPVIFVLGEAKVSRHKISTQEWGKILAEVLQRIKFSLRYLAGFKPLAELLNSQVMTGCRKFVTSNSALPNFQNTGFSQRTKFFPLDMWEYPKVDKQDFQIKRGILLLTDNALLAILNLSCFKQDEQYTVCKSSLIPTSLKTGHVSVLSPTGQEISELIDSKLISVVTILDRLYLSFHYTIADREKYLVSMRGSRDWLKQAYNKIS